MSMTQKISQYADKHPDRFFFLLIACFTLIKIVWLGLSQVDLGPDEAQYWWWSKSFDVGYFSKPPMIAWLIGLTTSLFGDAEWAVRLMSPLLTAGTAIMIYLIGKALYDQRTGFWAGIIWSTLPVILLSNMIISTDLPLLFFWSVALYAFIRLGDAHSQAAYGWAIFLGLGIGLGMLSKYAMIYFPLGMALAALLSAKARKSLRAGPLVIALLLTIMLFLPNILWNAANDFHTLEHTGENASWSTNMFNFDELAEFFFAQFLVAGPLIFGFFLWHFFRKHKQAESTNGANHTDSLLLGFALPPLIVICLQAFISKANANWAMATYPSLVILVTALALRWQKVWILKTSVAGHAVVGLMMVALSINMALADSIGASAAFKRHRYWAEQAEELSKAAAGYDIILVDDRELMGNLLYYMRDRNTDIYAWDLNRRVDNHYEAFFKYDPSLGDRALLIAKHPQYIHAYAEFQNILDVGSVSQDTKVTCPRTYTLYELSGYDGSKGEKDILVPPGGIKQPACKPY
jgi:hypothetical protein